MSQNHNRKMKQQNEPQKSYENGYISGYAKGYDNGYIIGYKQGYKLGLDQLGNEEGYDQLGLDHISDTEYSNSEADYELDFESDFGGTNDYGEDDYEHDFESDFGNDYGEDDYEHYYESESDDGGYNGSECSGFTIKSNECNDFLESHHGLDLISDTEYSNSEADYELDFESDFGGTNDYGEDDSEYGYDDYCPSDYESDYGYSEL